MHSCCLSQIATGYLWDSEQDIEYCYLSCHKPLEGPTSSLLKLSLAVSILKLQSTNTGFRCPVVGCSILSRKHRLLSEHVTTFCVDVVYVYEYIYAFCSFMRFPSMPVFYTKLQYKICKVPCCHARDKV